MTFTHYIIYNESDRLTHTNLIVIDDGMSSISELEAVQQVQSFSGENRTHTHTHKQLRPCTVTVIVIEL